MLVSDSPMHDDDDSDADEDDISDKSTRHKSRTARHNNSSENGVMQVKICVLFWHVMAMQSAEQDVNCNLQDRWSPAYLFINSLGKAASVFNAWDKYIICG